MKHKIVERKQIGKGKYSITTYNGYLDYITTKGIVGIISGIIILPFLLIYWFYKYLILGLVFLFKKMTEEHNKE